MKKPLSLLIVLLSGLLPFAARAATLALPATEPAAVVAGIVALIRQHYVIVESRPRIAGQLDGKLLAGDYAGLAGAALADALTSDLQSLSADRHLRVQYNPARSRALQHTDDADPQAEARYWAGQAVAHHFGIGAVRQFDGNVGYLELTSFWTGDEALRYLDAALTLLRHDDAVILDLRGNKGGESEMVRYLASIFLNDREPRLLDTIFDGMSGTVEREYSSPEPLSALFAGKPLYVLIGPRTFSAGEAFAQHVRNFRLGTLVGATTAGAAHTVELLPLADGYVLSLPTGQTRHAVTGDSWEGKGVQPHVETAPDEARTVALQLARKPPR